MSYSRDIYSEVEKQLYKLRTLAIETARKRKGILFKRSPRAEEIEKALFYTATAAARAVLCGSDSRSELIKLKNKNEVLQEELRRILKKFDLPENYLDVKYSCSKCSDEGFVDGMMCGCMKNLLKKASYARLNRLSPLELSLFDNFSLDYYSDIPEHNSDQPPKKRMSLILNYCKKYAYNFNKNSPSLIMKGHTGLGKTHLSLAIAREVINSGYGVIYVSTQNMVTKLEKEKFQNHTNHEIGSERHFIDCDLLIIDDLGTEFSTSFSNSAIYNIINSRIMMNKPTIISTNLSMRELEKNYTERIVSRIIGNNIRLEFMGSDIRQRKLKNKF